MLPRAKRVVSITVLVGLTGLSLTAAASSEEAVRRDLPAEARQFDFWLGRWDVNLRIKADDGSWPDGTVAAVTEVYAVLGGKAILELWDSKPIKGLSLRYFDPEKDAWHLWLNWPSPGRSGSSGLEGSFRHGRGEFFSTRTAPDGSETISRYTFSDITPTRLRWDDAFSVDGGKSWTHGWIMEFSRSEDLVTLPAEGGPAHTFETGERCADEQFRRLDALAGRLEGIVRTPDQEAARPAVLIGYRILDGCSVLVVLQYDGEDQSLHLLTWNTHAEAFEESVLDRHPESALEVFYGSESDGEIELLRSARAGGEPGGRQRTWRLGLDSIELRVLDRVAEGDWQLVREAEFARHAGP